MVFNLGQSLTPIDFISIIQSKVVEEKDLQFGYDLVFAKPDVIFYFN